MDFSGTLEIGPESESEFDWPKGTKNFQHFLSPVFDGMNPATFTGANIEPGGTLNATTIAMDVDGTPVSSIQTDFGIFSKSKISQFSSKIDTPVMPNFLETINAASKLPSQTINDWHLKLAHIGKKKILALADMEMIKIKDPTETIECTSCDAAKMKRKAFSKSMPPKADNIGEVIYSDVCGKISPPTMFGEQYIVTFIDELSGYISVFLIKHKSDVFSHFKDVRAHLNNQNATTSVKMFVSDGGGEYIDTDFQDFLKEKGIVHVKTPPNTPQRNGKSERLNKILFDLARAMLKHRKLPRRFWGEAVLYASYIINRTPKIGNDKTRHEMLFGRKSSLEKTLEFGTPVRRSTRVTNPKTENPSITREINFNTRVLE